MENKIEISETEYKEFLKYNKIKKVTEKEIEIEKSKKKIISYEKKLEAEKTNLKVLKVELSSLK
jgi:hypothetical protein